MSAAPWFVAAQSGDIEALAACLQQGESIHCTDEQGNTALHIATLHQQQTAMAWLINHGASLNTQNLRLATPLHLTEKNSDSIRLLLEAGANPNIKDSDCDYPYYFAFYGAMTRELTLLYIQHGAHLILHEKA